MGGVRRLSLDRFRKELLHHKLNRITVLAGAGVSMLPPTSLVAGDRLRDMCVECLLTDAISRRVIRRLLRTPAYRRILPESALQMLGSTIGADLDTFIRQVMNTCAPNVVHQALADAGCPIFTTNFDLCFEKAGGASVRHIHGSIARPETLQNQLYRLGKTSRSEALQFGRLIEGRVLLVVGYSFRDDDVAQIVEQHPPKFLMYLSYDGTIPDPLSSLPCEVKVATGSVEQLLRVTPSAARSRIPRLSPRPHLPALRHRANAVLRLCRRAALYKAQVSLLHDYLPKLHGRQKLLAMCDVAEAQRLAMRYNEADDLALSVLTHPAARMPVCKDAISTALVQRGLVALDRGDTDFVAIEKFFRDGLQVFEELVATEPPGRYAAENDIWRAQILNNLGLVLVAGGRYRAGVLMYERSIRLKEKHHERYGIAQAYANLARAQILLGDMPGTKTSLKVLAGQMAQIPDAYICWDAISGCLAALNETNGLTFKAKYPAVGKGRSGAWWNRLIARTRASPQAVRRIIAILRQLHDLSRNLR
jgi:tetratricopeptide (TPR) repeat protein